jgi:hypothetical protein
MTIQEAHKHVPGASQWVRFDCDVSEPEGCRGTYGLCSRCNYYYAVCNCGAYHAICKCGIPAEYDQIEAAVATEEAALAQHRGEAGGSE